MEFQCEYFVGRCGYTCEVKDTVKTSSTPYPILITGQHSRGKSTADVKLFEIKNQPLDAFPRNLHEKFPNMTLLWISGCNLKKISKTDLIGLENLEILDLNKNNLTSLPDDLFADMKKLQWINFSNNKLERLSSKVLKPIEKSLEHANFTGNTKIDDYFYKDDKNKSLKRLMDIIDSLSDQMRNFDQLLNYHQQMTTKLVEFKASANFSDFTIKVRGKEFKVHKTILAAQSPVFEKIFINLVDDGTTEKTFTKVQNFSEKCFGSFLDFFYSSKIGDEVDPLDIFELATVFEVAILEKICVDKITATLSDENALEVYNLAHHHDSVQLKEKAFKVIQKLFPELHDEMIDNLDQINKLVIAKREFVAILESIKQMQFSKK